MIPAKKEKVPTLYYSYQSQQPLCYFDSLGVGLFRCLDGSLMEA